VTQDHFPDLWSALMCSSVLCVCRVLLVNKQHEVETYLTGTEWGGKDRTDLDQVKEVRRALVSTVMNPWITYNSVKFLRSCTIGSHSRRINSAELVSEHECS
jgi:hypothetical protein